MYLENYDNYKEVVIAEEQHLCSYKFSAGPFEVYFEALIRN